MKKIFIKLAVFVLFFAPLSGFAAAPLNQQFKGRILLQVESHGEAWYINPNDAKRVYLKDGAAAYGLMRNLGLGITDADLKKIPVGVEARFQDTDTDSDGLSNNLEEGLKTDLEKWDTDGDGASDGNEVLEKNTNPLGVGYLTYDYSLINKLKGKILLQVQSRGQAWYLNPVNGKRYYLKDGNAAYQIMRYLSLGITNANLNKIPVGQDSQTPPVASQTPSTNENIQKESVKQEKSTELETGTQPAPAAKTSLTNSEIIQKIKPSVVYLETNQGQGTGFIIDVEGQILTNAHVVEGVSTSTVKLFDNRSYTATVVARDEIRDLALLTIPVSGLTPAELGNSDEVKQGDQVFSFGYPFGIEGDVSFKDGTISRNHTIDGVVYFETSVDSHPGNSGGPLVNKYGQVIGVNTYVYGYAINGISVGETIKFSLPINTVKNVLPGLKNGASILKDSNTGDYVKVELVPQTFNSTIVSLGTQNTEMMKIKFTSTYEKDIKITGITFKRNGLIDNTEFSNTSLLRSGQVIGNGNFVEDKITFTNLPLSITANSSLEITLVATIAPDVTNYFHITYLTIEGASSFVTEASITGEFPIQGRTITLLD
ncbi:MAG: hypothetical protein A2927_01690 [Candidatus Komeilibacteria bacterium RIFCSPLOWO2_01_FULL_45_10]|uniref:Serine protease n=1 Tax=Candidatus Komeilibacteria bacterium RIFCSPLOWO2_01_FULL_45_10 TaxID=1798550 RepID=A0A1G2BKH6_9BACT|nr:MAG: hypothetical protein A2927_01690 [Candidatus Komeilibacteria bacterium RIFCSPLOWO2_01_FULL_45_10]